MDKGNERLDVIQAGILQKTKLRIDQEETSCRLRSTGQDIESETVNAKDICILPETPLLHAPDDSPPPVPLSKEHALNIVAQLFENRFADRIDKAEVLQDGNCYIVIVPSQTTDIPEGSLHYGPSYSARIVLDVESGALVEARIGR